MKQIYFACLDGEVGSGFSVEEAYASLVESYVGICNISEVSFYEGKAIKVELKVKQVPVKTK